MLQKNYEAFVNDLPKTKNYELSEEEINKLHHSIISIVAKDKDDQERLQTILLYSLK